MLGRPGFIWRTHETKHLWLHCETNTYAEGQVEVLAANQEAAMSGILDLLGEQTLPRKVHVFAVEDTGRMKTLTGYGFGGLALPTMNSVCFIFSQTFHAPGAHELTHVVSQGSWGLLPLDRSWLNEGFACFAQSEAFAGGRDWDLHASTRQLRDSGRLVPLPQLHTNFSAFPATVTYSESGSFVKFLYESYGREKLKQLWKSRADLPRIYGKSLAELEAEWYQNLDRSKNDP